MPEIKNTFLKGKMNKDADERVLPSGEYKDALNIQVGVSEDGDAGSLHNILGNSKLSNIGIPNAKCIGSIADTENEKIYWFIYSVNIDAIAEYDETTGAISPVLVDTTKEILKFPNKIITAINVVEGYLSWTDNNSEPKLIDIELFKSRATNFTTTSKIFDSVINSARDIKEEDITVIRKKPLSAPIATFDKYGAILKQNDTAVTVTGDVTGLTVGDTFTATFSADPKLSVNDTFWIKTQSIWVFPIECKVIALLTSTTATLEIVYDTFSLKGPVNSEIKKGELLFEEKFVRFAYRLRYSNDQYSVMSPFTETVFDPYNMPVFDIETGYNENMVNSIKGITLSNIDATDPKVKAVDILYKESNNTNVYVFKTVKKEDLTNYNTTSASIEITNESAYTVLPENQLFRQYDNVPYRAQASEIVANRLIFGNYTDGMNITKNLDGEVVDFNPVFNINTANRQTNLNKSIKTNRTYQVGIVFEDEYGRQTPVISDDTGSFTVSSNEVRSTLTGGKELEISMGALPSDVVFDERIKKFKYYIKDNYNEYYNLFAIDAYIDKEDDAVWVVFPSSEINKIQENDYIVFKRPYAGGTAVADKNAKYKILDIKDSKPDTIEAGRPFNASFFVKINRDKYLNDYFLSKLRPTEVLSSDFHKIDYIPEDSFFLTYVENGSTRTEYYFKYGNVYEVDTDIDGTPSTDSNIAFGPMSPACDITLPAEYGRINGSPYNFEDITGQLDTAYLKFKYNASNHIYKITSFYFCYDTSSGIIASDEPAVFETVPTQSPLDLYYETEKTYNISDFTSTKTLTWFNCFDFGNGIESNRIKDDYNAPTISKGARVSTVIDKPYKEKINKNGLIFSGIFNARNDFNRLNEFNVAENITKNLNPEYGSIQKLHTRDTDLIAFCEDKILRILANKDALYNADGNVNLTSTNAVLGQALPYKGEFGISTNPESFASYGYQIYFTDKARNAVLRLSMDGLTVISNYGMSDYFRDKFNTNTVSESIAFKEGIDGWTSRLSFVPESGISLNGKYYTFKDGEIWKHYNNGTNYNNFYGTQYDSKVKFIYNQDPSSVKSFKTLGYEGTEGWSANSIETDEQSGKVPTFIDKEGKWFNKIQGITTDVSNIDPKEFSIQGLGNITSYTGTLSDQSTTPSTSSETLISPDNIVGSYDIYSKQYILSFGEGVPYYAPPSDCTFTIESVTDFDCSYAILSVDDGIVGDNVSYQTTRGNVLSISPSTYQQGLNDYTATIIAPSGFNNSGDTFYCVDSANALPLFECADAGLSIPDGTIGATVTGTVTAGTIQSISPATYSSGTNAYTATILVPSGYSNSGSTIDCQDNATGVNPASAEITGPTTGTTGSNITLVGEDNNFTGSTWSWTGGAAAGLTSKSITFNESTAGTVTYGVTIDGTYTDTHNVTWSAPTPTLTCSTTGFNLSDGITGDTITASDYTITNGTVQSITPSTYQSGSTTYSIDILVPAGYTNTGSTLTCTDTATGSASLPAFTCTDAGFAVADGTTGDTIGIGTDATVTAGTLNSVSPSTYQSGTTTYTANITVPSGYSNSGSTLTTCTDTATGSASSGSTYTQYIVLSEAVSENPTYTATWPVGTQTVSTGDLGPKTKTATLSGSSVLVSVSRTNPDATVEDATQIQFSRNSDAVEYTVNKSVGDSVTTESYTFTGVNSGDILKINIAEG